MQKLKGYLIVIALVEIPQMLRAIPDSVALGEVFAFASTCMFPCHGVAKFISNH